MGLLRGVARTAVVAGTATAVSNRVSRRQAGRWADQEQAAPQQAPPPAEPVYAQPVYVQQAPTTPPPVDMDTKLAQLKDLGQLKEQGVLSDAEFEVQKNRILGQ
ncbi:SHOCT domain-containing protein [Cellulomonas sp. 179-A 4D5 NHS]|uniref:SHOCT domain-containing protein n=1 Tax=Cellulomonas sp. 179-A 4D5 NHS TaxID=3142378 RepID=UPI00399F8107